MQQIQGLLQQYHQKLVDFVNVVASKTDDEVSSLRIVVALDTYQKLETQIIEKLGLIDGEKAIYQVKKQAVQLEKQLGGVILADAIQRLEAIFALATLYGANGDVVVDDHNNQDSKPLVLKNDNGQVFNFEKFAQITYKGDIYFELNLLDDLKIGKLNYYKVIYDNGKQRLVRERDKSICDQLYQLCEIY